MEKTWERLLELLKWSGALCAVGWGNLPATWQILLSLMILDIASGALIAWMGKDVSSREMFNGLLRKALVLMLVGASKSLEPLAGLPVSETVAGFYIVHECLSLIENAGRAGLPVPKFLLEALRKVPGHEDEVSDGPAVPQGGR